ncbi:MAG: zinc transporter ZupT, zinc transporter, ZIP family [Candidatus Peregrinibacteria bacterium GW2011_GWF2_43_17]|nr:MAG: zinc transporter ZupT, zinc transporter, ZIP family [Candidatus Peregrinibacteria bacterium GW2011_GWF2_43_17]KKT18706.1 MAG: Zinc transporter ZupT [Candidatus Peregrinibacteria bacterium GW2011_GWA2_43_8]HAU40395.1 zinc transporter ZupT [Candidatus Peregrinibacteria bacterium]
MDGNIILAISLSLFAGLSTVFGGLLIFWVKEKHVKTISFGLGFSAGVMTYMALFELMKEASMKLGSVELAIVGFMCGVVATFVIDFFTHKIVEGRSVEEVGFLDKMKCKMENRKAGIFTAIAIAVHNFPEGITTFSTAMVNPAFGISIAIAVAIHNIPEGFCVALPTYCATGEKKKSILYALYAGLAEPAGAIITYAILYKYINDFAMSMILAGVAGVMIYISFDELLPLAKKTGKMKMGIVGFLIGILAMMGIMKLL